MVIRLLLCTTAYIIADSHNAHADQGSDKKQTDSNFKNYIPEMYSEYVPDMGNGGFRYQKYMQGQPNAMKFQQKVLPQGNYQQYIPLSQEQSKDSEAASAVVLASTKGEKKEESKESKSANKDSHHEETGLDLERYMQQPSPGPVVNKKYGKYIPSKYRDYVPEMDESGIKYQKYMQGQSDAMKFQQKVLPEGEYQKDIPLSQEQSKDSEAVVLASAKGEKKEESKESKSANKDSHHEETGLDLERYMQQPSPGPVVNKKYGKYIPSKYRDYVPEMDESGIKYQKYMQGQPNAHTPESSIFEIELDKEPLRDRSEQLLRTIGIIAMLAAASVLAFAFRRQRSAPVGLQQPLTANADGPFINQSV